MLITKNTIEKLKARDERTFTSIYNEYQNLVYYICYSFTHDKMASEDLMQDTFIKLLENIDSYNENGKFKEYLTEIARNISLNYVTRITNNETHFSEDRPIDESVSSADDETDKLIDDLHRLLGSEDADIVILKVLYDYRFREIAIYKKKTIGEIQSRYYKAIEKIKQETKKGGIKL